MEKYSTYSVSILLEKDGDLENRIKRSAEERGIDFQSALQEVIEISLWAHMKRNMDLVESAYCQTV